MCVFFQLSEYSKKNMDTTEQEEVKQEIEEGSGDNQNGEDTSMVTNDAALIKEKTDIDGLDDDFIKESEPGQTFDCYDYPIHNIVQYVRAKFFLPTFQKLFFPVQSFWRTNFLQTL